MLGTYFCSRRRCQQGSLGGWRSRLNLDNFRSSVRERAGFVQENGIYVREGFQVDAAFDDRALLCRAPNRTKNRQRGTGGDAASSGNDYNGNGGPHIVRDE